MNDTLNLTLSTNPSMLAAMFGTIVTIIILSVGISISNSLKKLAETIKRKDFKLKPSFNKETGELEWEETRRLGWPFF